MYHLRYFCKLKNTGQIYNKFAPKNQNCLLDIGVEMNVET